MAKNKKTKTNKTKAVDNANLVHGINKGGITSSSDTQLPEKPKRPLSSFNLFYRYKRQKVLDAITSSKIEGNDKEAITSLINVAVGLEDVPQNNEATTTDEEQTQNQLRRSNIRSELESNLTPRDTRNRAHRANQSALNGSMSFLEMGNLVTQAWKRCDEYAKEIFRELADEGREVYRKKMEEYDSLVKRADDNNDNDDSGSGKKGSKSGKKKGGKDGKSKEQGSEDSMNINMGDINNGSIPALPPTGQQYQQQYQPSALGGMMRGSVNEAIRNTNDWSPLPYQGAEGGGSSNNPAQNPSQQQQQNNNDSNNSNAADNEEGRQLRQRVRELEGELNEQRLWARIRSLEEEVARGRERERELRAAVLVASSNNNNNPGGGGMSGMNPYGAGVGGGATGGLNNGYSMPQQPMMYGQFGHHQQHYYPSSSAMHGSNFGNMQGGMYTQPLQQQGPQQQQQQQSSSNDHPAETRRESETATPDSFLPNNNNDKKGKKEQV